VSPAAAACDGEIARARATAATIEAEWPLRGADEMTAFVRDLGDRLARHDAAASQRWTFVVVRNHAANAFAVGDGRIYVTDGAIDACVTEAELAAMIAHEMGHQLANHFCAADASSGQRRRIGGVVQHIDPEKELEADRVAVQVLIAAGYDPRAALTLAIRVAQAQPVGARPDEVRIQALRQLLESAPARGRTDSDEFRRLKRTDAGR
jgi:beta-barrel assembly-enhancing protease